jgi:hypothetical protein
MNKRDKIIKEKEYEDLIDFNVQSKKQYGVSKCWKGVSKEHWDVMCDIVWKLVNEYEMKVKTEVTFKSGGRCDLFAYSGQLAIIVEVLHSEKDERFEKKKDYYPLGIPIMKVRTKDFKIEDFKV